MTLGIVTGSDVVSTVVSWCDIVGKPLNLLRAGRWSAGIDDRTVSADDTAGSKVVGDLHVLRDGQTDANGVENDDTKCLLRGSHPDGAGEVSDDDDDDT
nr:hypothetical protein [Tanacetum cinerariifolium]